MGCACLQNRLNELNGETNENKEIEEVPYNNDMNYQKTNNENDIKNNPNSNKNYMIVVGNQNKNALELDSSNNVLSRAKSTPPRKKEEEGDSSAQYKQIDTNLITPKEFEEFCIANEPLNDDVKVEIKPTTSCENKTIYYGEWDISNNKRHGRGIQIWPDGSKYLGYWKSNQAWGKGKLIHQDGDI